MIKSLVRDLVASDDFQCSDTLSTDCSETLQLDRPPRDKCAYAPDCTIEDLIAAEQRGDFEAMFDRFDANVELISPATPYLRFRSLDEAKSVLSRIYPVVTDVELLERTGQGTQVQMLVWKAKIKGTEYEEVNVFRMTPDGSVIEMKVFFRPVISLLVLVAHIVPLLGARKGKIRPYVLKLMLQPLVVIYKLIEKPLANFVALDHNRVK